MARAGIAITTTEHFLNWTRRIGSSLSDNEKRLYLRTANAHMESGCPLLSLDVLMSLPKDEENEFEIRLSPDEQVKIIFIFRIVYL